MNLRDLAMMIDQRIELWAVRGGNSQWGASFVNSEIKEGCILGGGHGWGQTPDEALHDLARKLAGKRLVTHAFDKEQRSEYSVPETLRHEP